MGTLDTSGAKVRFFGLVDEIGASHLPGFVVWLDHKLAEYKANGHLKPDTDSNSNEQYPQWIAKALRQNLSFIFSGCPEGPSSNLSDSDSGSKSVPRKRRRSNKADSFEPDRNSPAVSDPSGLFSNQPKFSVKEEVPSSPEPEVIDFTHPEQSLLPGVQSSYSSVSQPPNGSQASVSSFSQSGATFYDQSQHETGGSALTSFAGGRYSERTGSVETGTNLYEQSQTAALRHDVPAYCAASSFSENFGSANFDPISKESIQGLTGTAAAVGVDGSLSKCEEGTVAVSSGTAATAEEDQTQGVQTPGTGESQDDIHGGKAKDGFVDAQGGKAETQVLSRQLLSHRCSCCGKVFGNLSHLQRHFVTHSKQKPYSCPHCQARFSQSSMCYRHQRKQHPNLPVVKVKSNLHV